MLCNSYVNILHAFCVRRKNWRFFSGSGKLNVARIFAQSSSQILSYINIFDINAKLLAPAFTWM